MELKGISCRLGELFYLAEEGNAWRAVVNAALNLRVP
jgi:hypothetical protein